VVAFIGAVIGGRIPLNVLQARRRGMRRMHGPRVMRGRHADPLVWPRVALRRTPRQHVVWRQPRACQGRGWPRTHTRTRTDTSRGVWRLLAPPCARLSRCHALSHTVTQLLWVNLIMDTMGALALATEDPNPSLLDDKVCVCERERERESERDEACVFVCVLAWPACALLVRRWPHPPTPATDSTPPPPTHTQTPARILRTAPAHKSHARTRATPLPTIHARAHARTCAAARPRVAAHHAAHVEAHPRARTVPDVLAVLLDVRSAGAVPSVSHHEPLRVPARGARGKRAGWVGGCWCVWAAAWWAWARAERGSAAAANSHKTRDTHTQPRARTPPLPPRGAGWCAEHLASGQGLPPSHASFYCGAMSGCGFAGKCGDGQRQSTACPFFPLMPPGQQVGCCAVRVVLPRCTLLAVLQPASGASSDAAHVHTSCVCMCVSVCLCACRCLTVHLLRLMQPSPPAAPAQPLVAAAPRWTASTSVLCVWVGAWALCLCCVMRVWVGVFCCFCFASWYLAALCGPLRCPALLPSPTSH
jgi:hypothetical protein